MGAFQADGSHENVCGNDSLGYTLVLEIEAKGLMCLLTKMLKEKNKLTTLGFLYDHSSSNMEGGFEEDGMSRGSHLGGSCSNQRMKRAWNRTVGMKTGDLYHGERLSIGSK